MDASTIATIVIFAVALVAYGLTCVAEAAFVAFVHLPVSQKSFGESLPAQMLRQLTASQATTAVSLVSTRVVLAFAVLVCILALMAPRSGIPWDAEAGAILAATSVLLALPALARRQVGGQTRRVVLAAAPWLFVLRLLMAPVAWAVQPFIRPGASQPHVVDAPFRSPDAALFGPVSRDASSLHDDHERRMIQSILELDATTAREIMTPRVDLVALPSNAPPAEIVEAMAGKGHSRIPIYEGTIDHIVGVVYARDYLKALSTPGAAPRPKDLARSVLFVPETKRLNDLLREFQQAHVHIAIIVDEYGGTAGVVTIEDLLEEIVGELADEFAPAEPEIQVIAPGHALVHARATLDSVNRLFGSSLVSDDVDTIGGYLFTLLGKTPAVGDKRTANGLQLEVAELTGRRVRRVRITRLDASTEPAVSPSAVQDAPPLPK